MQKPMSEKRERLVALFKLAIEREQESQKLYLDMAATCEDDDLRQVIETLRDSERMHEEVLLERYKFLQGERPLQGLTGFLALGQDLPGRSAAEIERHGAQQETGGAERPVDVEIGSLDAEGNGGRAPILSVASPFSATFSRPSPTTCRATSVPRMFPLSSRNQRLPRDAATGRSAE